MPRPFPWKCRSCGQKTLAPLQVNYPAKMEHDGKEYSFTVPDLELLECSECHERVLPDEAYEKVLDALRKEVGLLSPSDIRTKREALGLTQLQLANLLKIAEETVSRWETRKQIQQRSLDTLLQLFFNVPEAQKFLGIQTLHNDVVVKFKYAPNAPKYTVQSSQEVGSLPCSNK